MIIQERLKTAAINSCLNYIIEKFMSLYPALSHLLTISNISNISNIILFGTLSMRLIDKNFKLTIHIPDIRLRNAKIM